MQYARGPARLAEGGEGEGLPISDFKIIVLVSSRFVSTYDSPVQFKFDTFFSMLQSLPHVWMPAMRAAGQTLERIQPLEPSARAHKLGDIRKLADEA